MEKMNLEKLLEFEPALWDKIATHAKTAITSRVKTGSGTKGMQEYSFEPYTEEYAKMKSRGMVYQKARTTTYQGRKQEVRAGQKYLRYAEAGIRSKQTTPPDFELTGKTMRGLSYRGKTKYSVTIGWRGEAGGIVDAHEDRGKFQVGGITSKEFDQIIALIDKELGYNWSQKVKDVKIYVKA